MKNIEVAPVLTNTHSAHGDTYEHPAFGMISYNHVYGKQRLVGSELEHNHSIRLRIQTADLNRGLSYDRFHGRKELIEIAMSDQQWATFVASPNTSGTPCTLLYAAPEGSRLEQKPGLSYVDKNEMHKDELKDRGREITKSLRLAASRFEDITKASTVKKSDIKSALAPLYSAIQNIESNLEFHIGQHLEMMESNVGSAKAEIEGYMNSLVYRLGIEKLDDLVQITNQTRDPSPNSNEGEKA